jgi:hypothetical protein
MATTKPKSVIDKPKIISKESKHTTRVIHLTTKDDCKKGREKERNYHKTGRQIA